MRVFLPSLTLLSRPLPLASRSIEEEAEEEKPKQQRGLDVGPQQQQVSAQPPRVSNNFYVDVCRHLAVALRVQQADFFISFPENRFTRARHLPHVTSQRDVRASGKHAHKHSKKEFAHPPASDGAATPANEGKATRETIQIFAPSHEESEMSAATESGAEETKAERAEEEEKKKKNKEKMKGKRSLKSRKSERDAPVGLLVLPANQKPPADGFARLALSLVGAMLDLLRSRPRQEKEVKERVLSEREKEEREREKQREQERERFDKEMDSRTKQLADLAASLVGSPAMGPSGGAEKTGVCVCG